MSHELRDEAFELLDRLEDYTDGMSPKDRKFVEGLLEKRDDYDESMRVSRDQVFWLRDIAERMGA